MFKIPVAIPANPTATKAAIKDYKQQITEICSIS
jgi:hypothetical protein